MMALFMCTCSLSAQDNTAILQKKVTIIASNRSLSDILQVLGAEAGVFFAYSNDIADMQRAVSLLEKEAPLQQVIERLFPPEQFRIRVYGQQIIISKKKPHPVQDTLPMLRKVQMNTVVVTALGISRLQRSLGYAYTAIRGSELTKARETNPIRTLSGRVAGLDITPVNSGPGGSVKITLRGVKLIGGDNQPLFVIDGVPVNNSSPGQADKYGGYDLGDGSGIINPDEIAIISVLKGGAAAALYGSRAANGVVLINTRKGCIGKELSFSSNITIESPVSNYDFQTDYGSGRDGLLPWDAASARDFPQLSWGPRLNADSMVWLWNGQQVPYVKAQHGPQQFFREGLTATHSVTAAAGIASSQLRFTYTHTGNKDIVPNSGLHRHHFSLRGTAELHQQLSMDVKISYLHEEVKNRPALSDNPNNIGYTLAGLAPNIDVRWLKDYKDPVSGNYINWNNNVYQVNPYWAINKQPNNSRQDRLNGFIQLKYQLLPSLYIQARTGTDYSQFRFSAFTDYSTPYNEQGSIYLLNRTLREVNSELLLHVDKQVGPFLLSACAGANRMDYEEELLYTSGLHINTAGIQNISNFKTRTGNGFLNRKRINSLYGAVNIAYRHWLYLDVTGRNDWSSTLSKAHRSYCYPSASASLVFSEWMQGQNLLSFGKLRFSVAQTGTDAIDPYQLTLSYGSDPAIPSTGGYAIGGVAVNKVPFEALKPSISTAYEAGTQLIFFNNRINLDLSWYRSNTRYQVLNAPLSPATGYTSAVINSGNVLNKGMEIALGVKPLAGSVFSWEMNINAAYNRNRILSLSPLVSGYYTLSTARWGNVSIVAQEGAAYGMIMGRQFLRDEQGRLILDASYLPQYDPAAATLGNSQYSWTAGVQQQFSYKNLSVSILLDIKQGGDIYSMTNLLAYANGKHKGTLEGRDGWLQGSGGYLVKGVQQTGTDADRQPVYREVSAYVNPRLYWQRVSGNIPEPFVYDASFIKLRQLSLDYRVPAALLRNTRIREVTVSLVARNFLTLSKHIPNVDPESVYNNNNAQGFEYGSLPVRRSCGINLYAKF
ncbi:SusC/RagA family TonB-linked outer membrane protein [uncultured Chitinophaga sp.]|jgi:TonB-linked outer membrane protein, SusC/RagA family|uniref:SusC/RagA family TonB-linked outer membrane protein n=1 Tax=uncultured Chitinophaga sp. TaxID=339340 RepID=UPI00260F8657|nr:SusC/RagA family TonB-linked outer membrane protein [uncultured Chitinophaga sp.]